MARHHQGHLKMSKGGSGTPAGQTTSTATTAPWSGQQPYLLQGFNQAQNLYNQGGPQYYPGQTYAGPTDAQLGGIQAEANLGQTGTQAQNAANPALANILGSSWLTANPGNPLYSNAASGNLNVNTGNLYNPIATGAQTNTMGMPTISGIAGGDILNTGGQNTLNAAASGALTNTQGQNTLNQFAGGEFTNAGNPYFQNMASTVAENVLPQIQGQFAAGNRLDSGLGTLAQSQGLGNAIGNLAYQNYQQGLQQQQGAASNLAQLGQSALGQQIGAAGTLGQLGASNLGAQLQAGGLMSNVGQQNIANQLAASNALTNLGFSNIGTQLSGAGGLSQNFMGAAGNQLGALGVTPSIGNLSYQQAGALQDAGQTTQGLNQAAINDAMQRWNYGQQQPYQNFQTYMQNLGGSYGSSGTESQPYYQNSLANTLAGGLGGSALIKGLFGSNNSGNIAAGSGTAAAAGGGNTVGSWLGNVLSPSNIGDFFGSINPFG
jgi:hypothetical protein